MKKVIIASTNPVKVRAVLEGFKAMFPGEEYVHIGLQFDSPVSAQPMNDAETRTGAIRRAELARNTSPDADYWVGVEGGVDEEPEGMIVYAWVVVLSKDRRGQARSASFYVPPQIADLVRQGRELGEADDLFFSRTNSKQENGAIGILTDNAIDRQKLYEPAVVMALIPFKNPDLYPIP
jgi:inosine/xanthosine triphosphatase